MEKKSRATFKVIRQYCHHQSYISHGLESGNGGTTAHYSLKIMRKLRQKDHYFSIASQNK